MSDYDMFKTTLMGGFDKDDVVNQFQEMKDKHFKEVTRMDREIRDQEEKIAELTKRLALKDAQKEKLEHDIAEKYQKYIDNYESITSMIFDARVQADTMVKEAETKSAALLAEAQQKHDDLLREAEEESAKKLEAADAEAARRVDAVQTEVDEKLAEGKRKYIAVQEEMNEIVELINQAQRRFMASYKEVHQIVSTMPESLRELEDEEEETAGEKEAAEEI